jgi:adenosylhomocysteine nucleosidase
MDAFFEPAKELRFAVLISANTEWRVVKSLFSAAIHTSIYGEYFIAEVARDQVLFFHGGWGKVAAAGSTQYVIDHFHPTRLINLGTCGGVEGRIKRFDVVVPEEVVIYDIWEAMGDSQDARQPAVVRDQHGSRNAEPDRRSSRMDGRSWR